MSGWWVFVALLPVWWLAIYLPTMRREEAEMMSLFGGAYAAYRERAPLLIPYRRPLPPQGGGFSWRNPNLSKTEVPRAFRFLSYPLMFVLAHRLRSEGIDLLLAPSTFDVLVGAGCISLLLVGRALRRHFKHQRSILPSWIIEDPARVAILLGVILIGPLVKSFEVEADWAIWVPGIALIGVSAAARFAAARQPAVSEALLAVGLAVVFELVWLALLLAPLYLAIALDQRLTSTLGVTRRFELRRFSPASGVVYGFLLGVGVALSLAKELWL
jgi:hypothetical protein